MITFRTSRWIVAGGAVLLLAATPCSAAEQESEEKKIETKVVVIAGEGSGEQAGLADVHHRLLSKLGEHELECTEKNGRKVCVARAGAGFGFGGTFLGVQLTDSTPELREHLGGPRETGVLVSKVEDDSPAAQAGILVGDIVTAVDGEPVVSAHDLRRAIVAHQAGDTVSIELYRDGRLEQISTTLARREPADFLERFDRGRRLLRGEEISERIREALAEIDLEDLDAEVRRQLEAIDWEEIRQSLAEALDRALEK